ncbi:GNAT family N-acetyltransferase [Sporosarcina jeotgali]|uniref:GNAT family N-acetyltransferase n=1 Tax=Sporosarcina jeotgali TaxID=3020056 RepID=A0ABZ0KT64_9BACL|nr:GNAT family N-acetyltransferase [Sporosarcina sp. B2O-1]WOV82983.1 GNAT family N-acetyltransferase [Sporosarcina sp. B2O-1]
MIVREAEISDAEKLICLMKHVESTSEYMLWEDGERDVTNARQKEVLMRMKERNNSTVLVAENESKELAGYVFAIGGEARRNKHSSYIVAGVSKAHRGNGTGTKLFEELEQWAKLHKIHRLELTVVTRNEAGLSLYQKMGFEIEGTKRDSLLIDDEFLDEYYMSKLLSPFLH